MTRKTITPAQRRRVIERYEGRCAECGTEEGPFDIDHRIAVAKEGWNDDDNLQPLCKACHRVKTNRDRRDIRKMQRLEAARKALEEGVPKPAKKSKIKNKGFQSWRKFNGEIVSKPQPPKE